MSERDIFIAALQKKDPAERAAYLDQACAGDAALRRRVEVLLEAHENAAGFLEKPAIAQGTTTEDHPLTEGPGTRIGPYKLLQQIGEGGMGVVYMAEQDKPVQRRVALKIIKPGMDSAQVIARFEAERQALAMMDHHNIARVFDAGTTDTGRPYFVMELVHGVPITKYCDANRLTPRERLELFLPVCRAIQHAHQKGIIHRDIKPSNVMVTLYDGQPVPKVIDFGVAKAIEQRLTERTMFTQYGAIIGTLEYMSPEQAEMSALGVDTRSDIYSLGVLLYELLTGTTPLQRKRLREAAYTEALRLIREEEPPKPSTRLSTTEQLASIAAQRKTEPAKLRKLVRGELDWIVMKALEKDRTRRYETANGLARDVERYLADEPVEACPPSAGYRLTKAARKYRKALAMAAAIVFLLVGGVVVSTWQAVRATRAETDALTARDAEADQRRVADDQRRLAEEKAVEARANLYLAHMNVAQTAWENAEVTRVLDLLDIYRHPAAGRKDLRGWEWYYQDRLYHDDLRTLIGHTHMVRSVVFSPDGQRLASASTDQTVKVWDAASGQELRTLKGHTDQVLSVVFSPDGQRLASAGSDGTVKLWDAASGQELRTLKGHTGVVVSVAFSPDGQRLASGGPGIAKMGEVKVWDVASGQDLRTLKGHTGRVQSVAFSPDSRRLASGSDDRTVKVWDVASGQELRTLMGHTGGVQSVAFSPDGQRLASGSDDQTVKIWDAASGQEQRTLKGHTDWVDSVAFSPDGQRLASASADRTVKVWDAGSGQELRTLKGHPSVVSSVAFSPDGQRLASAGWGLPLTVKLWDATSGQEFRTLKGHTKGVESMAFSPDGQRLASASWDQTVKVWDAASGQELRTLQGHTGPVSGVAFSPDGQRLASASWDQTVKVWDTASGQELRTLKGHTNRVKSVAFSPDGQRLASASEDRTVKLWDAASGQELRTLTGHTGGVLSVTFSPDGQRLASASEDRTVKVWDTASGQELCTLKGHSSAVTSVAFSPDGQRLASASHDQTVKVWDTASGQELHTLKGHTDLVRSVIFNPDGQRLASASWDKTVKVWDAAGGRELRTLRGDTRGLLTVAFSPDGQRLASAGQDGLVRVWDASPLTPEVQIEREALGLLEFFCPKSPRKAELIERIRGNKTISEAVRQKALALLESYWQNQLHGEAQSLVQQLFAKPLLRADVLESIRADPKLREEVRREALALADQYPEDAFALNQAAFGLNEASWKVVRLPGAKAAEYRLALRQAKAACRGAPESGFCLNTLGVAQYRLGKYKEALDTLTRSDKLNSASLGSQPADFAFLAMAQHQLGQKEKAQASLDRLREIMRQPQWAKNDEAQGFLREAEALLQGPADKPKK